MYVRRKRQRVGDPFGVLAGDAQADADRRADAEEHGLVALAAERLEREVAPQRHVRLDVHAHPLDHADLAGHDLAGQAIGRNGLHEHAAGPRFGLENHRPVAQPGEEVGARQARRPGADDGDLPLGVGRVLADLGQLDRHFLIDHEALDAADGNGRVERAPPALVFAGVEADPRADRRQRVLLAVQPQGLGVTLLGDQRHVAGDIDVRRAGAGAGGVDQRRANARAAMLVADVLDVFVAEVADGREHGVGRGLAQAAERRVLDHLAQVDEPLDVGLLAVAFADAVEDLQHPLRAHAAGHALAARFFLHEFEEEAGNVDHAAIFVHHDQAAGAHDRAEFGKRLVVQRHVQVLLGNAAAGGPADLRGLELLARRSAAAHVVDQIAQRHADGHFHEAGILDRAGQGEDLGAAALFRAVARRTTRRR